MSFVLMGILFFLLDLVAIVLLVATWQRTRVAGFAIVAASLGAGILARWTTPFIFRIVAEANGDWGMPAALTTQLIYLVIAAIALAGFWDIYRALKSRPVA